MENEQAKQNIPFWQFGLYTSSMGVEKPKFEKEEKQKELEKKAFEGLREKRLEQIEERLEPEFDEQQAKNHPPMN